MAQYLVHGSITFSSTTNATNAYNALVTAINNYPEAVASSRAANPGISRASAVVNFSYEVPEASVTAFAAAVRAAWTPYTRSNMHAAAVRIEGS